MRNIHPVNDIRAWLPALWHVQGARWFLETIAPPKEIFGPFMSRHEWISEVSDDFDHDARARMYYCTDEPRDVAKKTMCPSPDAEMIFSDR